MCAWSLFGSVQLAGDRLLQDVGYQGALSAARDTRHCNESTERELHIEPLKVVFARPLHDDALPAPLPSCCWDLHGAIATDECTSDGVLRIGERLERAVHHHLPAELARAWPNVNDPVGGADRLFVVLHHEDGVPKVAESQQRGDQTRVVTLVQPDGRLVKDVEHTDKS